MIKIKAISITAYSKPNWELKGISKDLDNIWVLDRRILFKAHNAKIIIAKGDYHEM